jgi:hypothetical protein
LQHHMGRVPVVGLMALKWLVAKASLQWPYNDQIMSLIRSMIGPSPVYTTSILILWQKEIQREEGLLSSRSATAETVHGTQELMDLCQWRKVYLTQKICSVPPNWRENHVISMLKDTNKKCHRFVTYIYMYVCICVCVCVCVYIYIYIYIYDVWWLGCVLSVSDESGNRKISFLHPHGPSVSYIYTAMPHILWLYHQKFQQKLVLTL